MTTSRRGRDSSPTVARNENETLSRMLERRALAHPERTAIHDGETEVTYRRLVDRADAVARGLLAQGVAPGSLVGVCMGRSWELVAALVGILRGGSAYVPLDPAYPQERLRYMLQHAGAAAVIVDDEKAVDFGSAGSPALCFEEIGADGESGFAGPSAQDLAYVIYTSGSTGRPKGVAVEHRSVVALSQALGELLDDDELSAVAATTSVCFDPSVMEILGSLSLGGTVVLAENLLQLPQQPAAQRVRTCMTVPSAIQALLVAGPMPPRLKCLVLGGEVLKKSLVERLHGLESGLRILNFYGPTEDTVFSTATEVPEDVETITIGKPVTGSRSYVLDESLKPVPVGVAGELYLAGNQLARGYLHDEELTRERFLEPRPSVAIPEERLYKTGDLARWRADGALDFLGRVDQQVKVRGFRVELEEIESTLESMPGVDGAAAALVAGDAGHERLAVYAVGRADAVAPEAVRAYLGERLPKYMVPQVVVRLEALPRLPNGKLDRQGLPSLEPPPLAPARRQVEKDSERSEDEPAVAVLRAFQGEIATLLGLGDAEQVPADRPLEDLGVDSLTAVELGRRLAVITGRSLPASLVIEGSTAAAAVELALGPRAGSDEIPDSSRALKDSSLARFQAQLATSHPPFLAAKAAAWSTSDKSTLVRELKELARRSGGDPAGKLLRTGSATRGTVAVAATREERDAIIWTTNLYLGLNRDPEVIATAGSALVQLGTGMGTSAAASGVTDLHLEFESAFAATVGKPAACLFPTGYTANLGVVATLLGENDVVVMDQLCHASLVDGARLCGATIRTFQHNNRIDLEAVLRTEVAPDRTVLVVIESVYSMGEGAAPLADIVRTAKEHGALVYVDEAHSFGFYGPRGAGLCAARGVTEKVDFIMTTLSKALGSLGGVVAASAEHVALLKSSSRAYIFQASVSPADIAAALAALRRLREEDALRERLWDTTGYMRRRFCDAGYDLGTGDGPIVTPLFADKDRLYAVARGLYERGVHTAAVTYPIVESGRGRLRFICSAFHTREDVDRTLEALLDAEREVDQALKAESGDSGRPAAASSDPRRERARLEEWAERFSAELEADLATATVRAPSLAISLGDAGEGEAISIGIEAGKVTLGAGGARAGAPFCSLRLTNPQAIAALCSSDVQGLLESVCTGSCVLDGHTEPFIWLIGRLAAGQHDAWTAGAAEPATVGVG
ncbi:MAG: amino acid adenylation domain-containing protein [Acidobacteriota bacterium]